MSSGRWLPVPNPTPQIRDSPIPVPCPEPNVTPNHAAPTNAATAAVQAAFH